LKVKSSPKDKIKIVTVRTTAFDKAAIGGGSASAEEVEATGADSESPHRSVLMTATTKYLSEELTVSSRPDLSSAGRVVSGGRALKSLENFNKVLDPLADALNAGTSHRRSPEITDRQRSEHLEQQSMQATQTTRYRSGRLVKS
jgi:electron transfer flavoprotein alpha subunit